LGNPQPKVARKVAITQVGPVSYGCLAIVISLVLWSGCTAQRPLQERRIGDLGRMEFRQSRPDFAGIVIGAPRGSSEPAAVEYAETISDETGAGLAVAYGFAAHRITVTQPLVFTSAIIAPIGDARRPGSIYAEYRSLLRSAAAGPLIDIQII
jgi:hypothetical protein